MSSKPDDLTIFYIFLIIVAAIIIAVVIGFKIYQYMHRNEIVPFSQEHVIQPPTEPNTPRRSDSSPIYGGVKAMYKAARKISRPARNV